MKAVNSDEMDCTRARESASARFDGELLDARELERHLGRCADCRAFDGALAASRGAMRELALPPTRDLWPRIAARTRRKLLERRLVRLAAALVGCVGTWALLRGGASQAPAAGADALAPIAALDDPHAELQRLAESPEHQLLLALAATTEDRR